MSNREQCDNCDRPVATQDDFDACPDSCRCHDCMVKCWRGWNPGARCTNEPADWRGRALKAEASLSDIERRVTELERHIRDLRSRFGAC